MKMNEWHGLGVSQRRWRSALVILAGTVLLVGTALAEEQPQDGTPSANAKPALRMSPHALAALRRAQEQGDESTPRTGLQSQMQKNALRRHLAPAKLAM